jgi:hypothetical protein
VDLRKEAAPGGKPCREDGRSKGGGSVGREATPGGRPAAAGSAATAPHPAAAPSHKVRGERRGRRGRRGYADGMVLEAEDRGKERERRDASWEGGGGGVAEREGEGGGFET